MVRDSVACGSFASSEFRTCLLYVNWLEGLGGVVYNDRLEGRERKESNAIKELH
jgi:hypothetical protein